MSLCVVKEWKRIRTGTSDELASALDGSRDEEEAMRYFITTQKRATSGIYYFFALLRSRSLLMFLQRRYEFERRFQPAHELLKPTEGWQPASAISCEKLCLLSTLLLVDVIFLRSNVEVEWMRWQIAITKNEKKQESENIGRIMFMRFLSSIIAL